MKEHCILLTVEELNHIHAAVHNTALDYLDWANDNPDDEELFGDILHQVCSIYSFWGDDRYLGAYNYLEQYDSLLHGLPILDQADNGPIEFTFISPETPSE